MTRRLATRLDVLLFVAFASGVACGDELAPVPSGVERIDYVPRSAELVSAERVSTEVPLTHALYHGGRTYFASATAVFELEAGGLARRRLLRVDGGTDALGLVRDLDGRDEQSLYVATDRGLFVLEGLHLLQIGAELTPPDLIASAAVGPLAGLWVADQSSLSWWQAELAEEIALADEGAPVRHLALTGDGRLALATRGGSSFVLSLEGSSLWAEPTPFPSAEIRAVAAGGTRLFATTPEGLFRTESDGSWRLFPFTEPALTQLVATSGDEAIARGDRTMLRVSPSNEVSRFAIPSAELELGAAHDGSIWAATSTEAVRLILGEARSTSFARELAPWLAERCGACHRNQTQDFLELEVFRGFAEEALRRVEAGDMPRCEGGLPCPPAMKLPESDYAILEMWIRDGKQP